jgi:hypothetical protein
MINFYNYIFANLYRWANGLSYDRSPEYTAFFSISFLTLCNTLTLLSFVRVLIGHPIGLPEIHKYQIGIVFIILLIPQYFHFIYRERFKKIADSFKDKNKTKGTSITWIYIILSIGLMFLVTYFMMIQNQNY